MANAQEDAELLMNAMLAPAEQMLQEQGFFYPYGGALKTDGTAVSVGGMDAGEEPKPEQLLLNIRTKLRAGVQSGDYRATALVFPADATLVDGDEPVASIAFALEHRDAYEVLVLIPWRLEGTEWQFGEPFAQQGKREIFGTI